MTQLDAVPTQSLLKTDSVTFTGLTLTGLTPSRLVQTDASNALVSAIDGYLPGYLSVDKGILAAGDITGFTIPSGAGTRLMWIPAKAAFRAGIVDGTQWDDANIGDGSVAFAGGLASGEGSFAFGGSAQGVNSISIGTGSSATKEAAIAIGDGCNATGGLSTAIGYNSSAQADGSMSLGNSINNVSDGTIAVGSDYTAGNNWAFDIGFGQLDYEFTSTLADFKDSGLTLGGTLTLNTSLTGLLKGTSGVVSAITDNSATWNAAQAGDATLTALAALDSSTGFLKQTAADTFSKDTFGISTYIPVANGSGFSYSENLTFTTANNLLYVAGSIGAGQTPLYNVAGYFLNTTTSSVTNYGLYGAAKSTYFASTTMAATIGSMFGLDFAANYAPSSVNLGTLTITNFNACRTNLYVTLRPSDTKNFTITEGVCYNTNTVFDAGSGYSGTFASTIRLYKATDPATLLNGAIINTLTAFYDAGMTKGVSNWGLGINTTNNYINGNVRVSGTAVPTNAISLDLDDKIDFGDNAVTIMSDDDGHLDLTADVSIDLNQIVFISTIKSGATQAGAGAAASEMWKTASHTTLPDNVLMIGV